MFTLSNFLDVIQRRHVIMKILYELELNIHGNIHKDVVKCLQSKIGASAETDAILDFRNKPSLLTKCICFMTVFIKNLNVLRIVISFIKVNVKNSMS